MNELKKNTKNMDSYLQQASFEQKKEKKRMKKDQEDEQLQNILSVLDIQKYKSKNKKFRKFKHKKYFSQFPDPVNSSIYVQFLNNEGKTNKNNINQNNLYEQGPNYKGKTFANKSKTVGIPETENLQKRQNKTCIKTKNRVESLNKNYEVNPSTKKQSQWRLKEKAISQREPIVQKSKSIQLPLIGGDNRKSIQKDLHQKQRMKTISSQQTGNLKLLSKLNLSQQRNFSNLSKSTKKDYSKPQIRQNNKINMPIEKVQKHSKLTQHQKQKQKQKQKNNSQKLSLLKEVKKKEEMQTKAHNLRLKQLKSKQKIYEKSQKQWRQIDFLRLKTCFYKIQLQINQSKDGRKTELASLQKVNRKKKAMFTTVPIKQNISQFIKNYQMIKQNQITVDDLVKLPKFGVDYQEKQSLYFGQLEGKIKQGFGIFISKIYSFQGIWKNNQKVQGVQYRDGGTFYGKFQDNKRQGVGRFVWDNGQQYSGQFKDGLKHGTGHWKNGQKDRYIGQWSNGAVEGYGIHTTQQGQKYEGNFVNFLKQGQGKQEFPNQDTFEGEYYQGKPHGKGIYKFKNGVVYQGQFHNGLRNGKGKLKVPNRFIYQGDFKQQMVTGRGKIRFSNGDSYLGEFKDGKMHGKGSMHYNGKNMTLNGVWKNNVYQPIRQQKQENFQ